MSNQALATLSVRWPATIIGYLRVVAHFPSREYRLLQQKYAHALARQAQLDRLSRQFRLPDPKKRSRARRQLGRRILQWHSNLPRALARMKRDHNLFLVRFPHENKCRVIRREAPQC